MLRKRITIFIFFGGVNKILGSKKTFVAEDDEEKDGEWSMMINLMRFKIFSFLFEGTAKKIYFLKLKGT